MPENKVDSPNPGTEDNGSTPTDERQKGQIGDMLMSKGPEPEDSGAGEPEPQETVEKPERGDVQLPSDGAEEQEDDLDRYGYRERQPEASEAVEEEEEEPSVPQPSDEVSALKEQIAELKGMVQGLTQGRQEEAPPESEPEPVPVEIDPSELLSQDEIDEFTVDPGKVLRTALQRVYQRAREDTLRDLPDVVGKATQRQTALNEARRDFWQKNTDLYQKTQEEPAVAQLVRLTANQVQSENPNLTLDQMFTETGKRVRKALNLHAEAEKIESKTVTKPPNQPGKPKAKRRGGEPEDNRTREQKQIDQMAASINR